MPPPAESNLPLPTNRRKQSLGVYLAAFAAYAALFWLGYWTTRVAGGLAPLWLSTGLGIWLILRFGPGMMAVIFLGAVPAYWAMAHFPLTEARGIELVVLTGLGRVLAAWTGAALWRWRREKWERTFGRFSEAMGCIIVAVASASVAATIGAGMAVLLGYETPARGIGLWGPWVAGDVVGVFFSLPLLLNARTIVERLRASGGRELIRGAILLAAAAAGCVLVFEQADGIKYLFVLFPVLWLATAWFESTGARLVALFYASAIIMAALSGHGPFIVGGFWNSSLTLQLLLVVVGLVALLLPPLHVHRSLLQPWPVALLFGSWIVGGVMFGLVHRQEERANAGNFAQLTDYARAAIEQRLANYMEALRISEIFVAATPVLGREAWATFSETLRIQERYPGILGIGVVYPVAPQATAAFEQRIRADGVPGFTVRALPDVPALPDGRAEGGEQFVVTFMAPLAGNEAGLGRDLATEADRRRTAEAARDTGQPRMTGRIAVTSDLRRRPAFMIFLPVYRSGVSLATVAERRAAFLAWIDAPFVMDDFIPEALRSRRDRVRLHLFTGDRIDAEHLVYSTEPTAATLPDFAHVNTIKFAGQKFTLGWNLGAGFVMNRQSALMWLALSLAVIAVVLTEIVLSLLAVRDQAEELARHRLVAQQASEARFQAIFEQAAMGVTLIELATGRYVRVNQRFCRIVGYPVAEILTMDSRSVTHPDDAPETANRIRQLAAGEISEFSLEKRYRHKEGHPVWVRVTISAMTADGVTGAFGIGTVEDITERKQAEAALIASEANLAITLNSIGDAVIATDADGRVVRLNGTAERLTGWTRGEAAGRPLPEVFRIVNAQTRQPSVDPVQLVMERGEVVGLANHTALLARDGREYQISDSAAPIRDPAGKIVGVVLVFSDVTEKYLVEAALRESEARLQRAESVARFGHWELAPDEGKVRGSAGTRALLGLPGHEWTLAEVRDRVVPEDRGRMGPAFAALVGQGKPSTLEFRIQRPGDGQVLDLHSIAEYDPGRRVVFGVVSDITARKRAEAERQLLEQQLRESQKLEAIGTLAGGIAHDFNNILSGIYGYAALARLAAGDQRELQDHLTEIERAGRRAAELVRQILTFSRTRGDDETRGPVQLGDVVTEVLKLLRASSPSTVEFVTERAPDLPSVQGSPSQLHQVVLNLGTNAVHAMRHGPGQLTIRLDTFTVDAALAHLLPGLEPGPCVRLAVRDTGVGMDAATRARVFEPFFTTKGPVEGTGLGLSVVHGIVRSHHGAIRVTSEKGQGATFEIFLPTAAAAPAPATTLAEAPRGQGERILLVDDEEPIAKTGRLVLQQLGYAVESETDVLLALARIEHDPQSFHLVIVDQTMPAMTGLEFARRLHALRADLPVILTSGYSAALTPERIRAAAVREFLAKPFSTEQLAAVVRRHLARV